MSCTCRMVARRNRAAQKRAEAAKATPKAMTPSTAYPYYDAKPMQFRGVKVRAEPPVWSCNFSPNYYTRNTSNCLQECLVAWEPC